MSQYLYNTVCALGTKHEVPNESIEKPYQDWIQDAWVKVLEGLADKSILISNIDTPEALHSMFLEHAGLVVHSYRQAIVDDHRRQSGRTDSSPRLRELLRTMFSIDGFNVFGQPWSDILEDVDAQLPLRKIEDFDSIAKDPRYIELSEEQKQAVAAFAVAFFMQESGQKLPREVTNKITRARKKTGLPLELQRGRVDGGATKTTA